VIHIATLKLHHYIQLTMRHEGNWKDNKLDMKTCPNCTKTAEFKLQIKSLIIKILLK